MLRTVETCTSKGETMSQGWSRGRTLPGDEAQGIHTWQPPGTKVSQAASVSSRWPLAIIMVLFLWPLGIAGRVFAARVKPALQFGDVTTAFTASNRVSLFFWNSAAIAVLYLRILIASPGSPSSTGYDD